MQINIGSRNNHHCRFHDSHLKVNAAPARLPLQPHARLNALSGHYRLGKSGLHRLEQRDVRVAKDSQDVLDGQTKGAQAMQDRLVEAQDPAEGGIDVEGIQVAIQSVQCCLVDCCLFCSDLVRFPGHFLAGHFDLFVGVALATKVATSNKECYELVQCYLCATLIEQLNYRLKRIETAITKLRAVLDRGGESLFSHDLINPLFHTPPIKK